MSQGVFASAYLYLTEHGIPRDVLDSYLQPEPRPQTMPALYRMFLEHARNRNMMPKVVWEVEQLERALCGFDVKYVSSTYTPAETGAQALYNILNNEYPSTKKVEKNELKKLYCRSIIDCAKYLSQFQSPRDFYDFLESSSNDEEGMIHNAQELASHLTGFGFALACDLIKELGMVEYCKTDVWVSRFIKIYLHNQLLDDVQVFRELRKLAHAEGVTPFALDRLIWLIGSRNFFKHPHVMINFESFLTQVISENGREP